MTSINFRYFIIHRDSKRDEPEGLFVFNTGAGRFDTIQWNWLDKAWVVSGSIVGYLVRNRGEAEETTRSRAEEVATHLGIGPIPSEEEFVRISDLFEDEARRRREASSLADPDAAPDIT